MIKRLYSLRRFIETRFYLIVAVAILASLWLFTPLRDMSRPETIIAFLSNVPSDWRTFAVLQGIFAIGTLVYVPVAVIALAGAMIFPFWIGLASALLGSFLAACTGYIMGSLLSSTTKSASLLRSHTEVIGHIHSRGAWAILALRLAPTPPFAFTSMLAGALRIRFLGYLGGTLLGCFPLMFVTNLFGSQMLEIMKKPSTVAGLSLLAIIIVYWVYRSAKRQYLKERGLAEQ